MKQSEVVGSNKDKPIGEDWLEQENKLHNNAFIMGIPSLAPVPMMGMFDFPGPLLIPIIAIIMAFSIPIISLITSYMRKKHLYELYHQERMAAISKGIEVPPLPAELLAEDFRRRRGGHETLRKGLVWLFMGIAIVIALKATDEREASMWGTVPIGIGLANLIYYALVGRKEQNAPLSPQPANEASRV